MTGLSVTAEDGGKADVTVNGTVTATGTADAEGVLAQASEGGTAEATVKDTVTAEGGGAATGAEAIAEGGSSASVTAEKGVDVTATAEGGEATGVSAEASMESTAEVTVHGSVTVEADAATGVTAAAGDGSSAAVTIDTTQAANGTSSGADPYVETGTVLTVDGTDNAEGLHVEAFEEGEAAITVAGAVEVSGNSATGIFVSASEENSTADVEAGDLVVKGGSGEVNGIIVDANGGAEVTVDVESISVTATEEGGEATGILVSGNEGADVSIAVKGDLTADTAGIMINGEGGSTEILVEGTVTGETGIVIGEDVAAEDVTLTVWAIDAETIVEAEEGETFAGGVVGYDATGIVTNAYNTGAVAGEEGEAPERTKTSVFEQMIQYIIRLIQPEQGGSLSVEGTQKYTNGQTSTTYDVAHEGDKVTLNIALPKDYYLGAAYNDPDGKTKVPLQFDEVSGSYYLVVEKGGGVCLGVELSVISEPEPAPAPAPMPKPETAENASVITDYTSYTKEPGEDAITATIVAEDGTPVRSSIKVRFYGDGRFCIVINGGAARVRGTFTTFNGVLTLVLADGTQIPVSSDGTFTIYLEDGTILVLQLEDFLIQQLMKI